MKSRAFFYLSFVLLVLVSFAWFTGCEEESSTGPNNNNNGNDTTGYVHGTITDSETGDALFRVEVTSDDGETTTTARDGSYSLVLDVGDRTLTAALQYYNEAIETFTLAGGDSTQTDITLDPSPGTLSGQVFRYGTSDPLAGVQLAVSDSTLSTDNDGNYSVTLHHGTYTMSITHDGYEPKEEEVTILQGRSRTQDIYLVKELTEEDYGTITGTVIDDDSRERIQGVQIRCDDAMADGTTDENGNYEILVLPGNQVIIAKAAGYETIGLDVDVEAGRNHRLDFRMPPSATGNEFGLITGTVTDANTNGTVAEVRISVGEEYVYTNAQGTFAMRVATGRNIVNASKDGYQPQDAMVDVVEDMATTVNFTLTPTGGGGQDNGTLRGRITSSQNGAGIRGARITCGGASATSDATGNYSMSVPAGNQTANVSANGFNAQSRGVVITAGQVTVADFQLVPGGGGGGSGEVTGRVVDATNQRGLQFVRIQVGGKQAFTDVSGDYIIRDLGAGNYTLLASADGYQDYSSPISIVADQTTTHNVSMQPSGGGGGNGQIRGHVRNSNGQPISGATVRDDTGVSTSTSGSGFYQFEVPSGNRTITASAGGYRPASTSLRVETNRMYTRDFTLQR